MISVNDDEATRIAKEGLEWLSEGKYLELEGDECYDYPCFHIIH